MAEINIGIILQAVAIGALGWIAGRVVAMDRKVSKIDQWIESHQDICDERHSREAEEHKEIWQEIGKMRRTHGRSG